MNFLKWFRRNKEKCELDQLITMMALGMKLTKKEMRRAEYLAKLEKEESK